MFELSREPLEGRNFAGRLADLDAGALVVFEGRVRRRNLEKDVRFIEYEAAEQEATEEFARLVGQLRDRFAISDALCVHRVGQVRVGEVAVWLGVTAVHRGEAFAACQRALDELKRRLPIWKKEHYTDGTSGWIGGDAHAKVG